jgi:hypothetical protein
MIGDYEVHRTWYGGVKDDSPVSELARYIIRDDGKLRRKEDDRRRRRMNDDDDYIANRD